MIIEDGPEAEEYVIYLLTDKTGKNYVPSLIFVSLQFRQRGLHEEEDKSSDSIIWIKYKKLKFDKSFFRFNSKHHDNIVKTKYGYF